MPYRKLSIFLVLGAVAVANAMPQVKESSKEGLFGLPFIQFGNGGIRFNFAGYHAEAGLGGLLDGSNTGGGLHASAGTPWGANAAAGLGGLLGGQDATAGGGLYARAGLGNGRPEAAAGLGGTLDGSGRSAAPIAGGLFAGATTGLRGGGSTNSQPGGPSKGTDNTDNQDEAPAGGAGVIIAKKPASRTSIQIVSNAGKSGKLKEVAYEAADLTDDAKKEIDEHAYKESHVSSQSTGASAFAGLSGAVYADSGIKDVEKIKVFNGRIRAVEEAPAVPALPQATNEVVEIDKSNRVRYPLWGLRKRVFLAPRKRIVYKTVETVPVDSVEITKTISRRQVENSQPERPQVSQTERTQSDDIFNIPISVLTSVNQLVKNNSG